MNIVFNPKVNMLDWVRPALQRKLDTAVAGRVFLVDLHDFDVQIVLTQNLAVNYGVLDVVTEWMSNSFENQLTTGNYIDGYSSFDGIVVDDRNKSRSLQSSAQSGTANDVGGLFTAQFTAAALFTRYANQIDIPVKILLDMQTKTLKNETALLRYLKNSDADGLGAQVVDARAFISATDSISNSNGSASSNSSLDLVIIIAVTVACAAFVFLLFAILWAWRYDRQNRDAYLVKQNPDRTGSDSDDSAEKKAAQAKEPPVDMYPSVIGVNSTRSICAESVLSDDIPQNVINTSLPQYYQAGISKDDYTYEGNSTTFSVDYAANYRAQNDAVSVSSMESYGYSLDGYSTATPLPKKLAVRPLKTTSRNMIPNPPEDDDGLPVGK